METNKESLLGAGTITSSTTSSTTTSSNTTSRKSLERTRTKQAGEQIINYGDTQILKSFPNVKFKFTSGTTTTLYFYVCTLIEHKYFESLFNSGMKETKMESGFFEIEINDFDPQLFNLFLNVLYKKNIGLINIDNALQLFELSDKYGIQFIKQECEKIIMEFIKVPIDNEHKKSIVMIKKFREILTGSFVIARSYGLSEMYKLVMSRLMEIISKRIIKKFTVDDIIFIMEHYVLKNSGIKCFDNDKLFSQLSWWFNNKMEQEDKIKIISSLTKETKNKIGIELVSVPVIEMFYKFFIIRDKKIWNILFTRLLEPYLGSGVLKQISKDNIILLFKILANKFLFKNIIQEEQKKIQKNSKE